MDHLVARIVENVTARVTGPMKFRLVLQPSMAIFLAIREGLKDARQGKPPYFWGCLTNRGEREAMLKQGWKSIGKVFTLAFVLDIIYQLIEHRWRVYVVEAALVAIILAIVPYLLVRGPINRIIRREHGTVKEKTAGH
jgi:hypothetical protein